MNHFQDINPNRSQRSKLFEDDTIRITPKIRYRQNEIKLAKTLLLLYICILNNTENYLKMDKSGLEKLCCLSAGL